MNVPPSDAAYRRSIRPVVCYPVETLPAADMPLYLAARTTLEPVLDVIAPPREAASFRVPAGSFFRIHSIEGPQVGDLNLWNAHDLAERFYSGKTRALHGTHLSTRRPAVVVPAVPAPDGDDHPRYARLVRLRRARRRRARRDRHALRSLHAQPAVQGGEYHHCCHSNLTRALAAETGLPAARKPSAHVHDVLNVFMCTGLHPRYRAVFHEGQPGSAGRLHRVLRRDRPAGRALGLPGRRLLQHRIPATSRCATRCGSRSCGRPPARLQAGHRRQSTPTRAATVCRANGLDARIVAAGRSRARSCTQARP